ncbi:hypothetical protein VTK73DRAFT_1159 [Phialemonium thermophilum]|uniref:Zn(2)-C6 fungal-type domain-containing protein n=1 Tax=Phialemonium thermophilum TaxID=223376 RepID=A0ABR3VTV5_9PEZI
MRACEGCRRRKIKCDAATTNTWPCAACVRLKVPCVRPNGLDGSSSDTQVYETAPNPPFDAVSAHHLQAGLRPPVGAVSDPHLVQAAQRQQGPGMAMYGSNPAYSDVAGLYQAVSYQDTTAALAQQLHYTSVPPPPSHSSDQFPSPDSFPTPPLQQRSPPDSPPDKYAQDPSGQQELVDLLGSLKVNEAGTAPYLNSKMRSQTRDDEEPAVEDGDEFRSMLPPLTSGPGSKVRIPPELMPDDDTVLHYFDLYFTHVHPYVPVLDKTQFYRQWHTHRESVSPLLLEAIFAIAGRLADEPAQGQQWLALVTRHADSFMDVPRLSTLQALLIILKARESAPKRGYYYRSWMSIVQCVQMGKDLGLDEHLADHQAGRHCGSNRAECLLKKRIWQTIFVCEVMIGSPQGRTDLQVDIESVDFSVPDPVPGEDGQEYQVSRNFTYFARNIRIVARMNKIYARIKKTKDWGIDPEFVRIAPEFRQWLNSLPPDLAISYPADGSTPWLPSPFVGNLHSYYCLSLILFHRPQLTFLDPNGADGQWKHNMLICYNAAKTLCRLQEAILQTFGLAGLQCMQRGINFTIYAVLACIVLHLVALVSPDPEFYSDAPEYFTRHMRILEKCMGAWPMPDMQKQVDAIREAFSADTRKPFVLKPGFPLCSSPPSSQNSNSLRPQQAAAAAAAAGYGPGAGHGTHLDTQSLQQYHPHMTYSSQPITPPISAGPVDSKGDGVQPMLGSSQGGPASGLQQSLSLADAPTWNPSRIFEQWNTSFGVAEVPTLQDIQAAQAQLPQQQQQQQQQQQIPTDQYAAAAAPIPTFVTPAMWRESVASVYEGGLKRAWDYQGTLSLDKGGR